MLLRKKDIHIDLQIQIWLNVANMILSTSSITFQHLLLEQEVFSALIYINIQIYTKMLLYT